MVLICETHTHGQLFSDVFESMIGQVALVREHRGGDTRVKLGELAMDSRLSGVCLLVLDYAGWRHSSSVFWSEAFTWKQNNKRKPVSERVFWPWGHEGSCFWSVGSWKTPCLKWCCFLFTRFPKIRLSLSDCHTIQGHVQNWMIS